MKRHYRLRDGDQVPTRLTTIREIMESAEFALGVVDARARRPYRPGYDHWHANGQWNYERGRAWANMAPQSVVLSRNGRVTNAAMHWYTRHIL
jgi:hypothetical protein